MANGLRNGIDDVMGILSLFDAGGGGWGSGKTVQPNAGAGGVSIPTTGIDATGLWPEEEGYDPTTAKQDKMAVHGVMGPNGETQPIPGVVDPNSPTGMSQSVTTQPLAGQSLMDYNKYGGNVIDQPFSSWSARRNPQAANEAAVANAAYRNQGPLAMAAQNTANTLGANQFKAVAPLIGSNSSNPINSNTDPTAAYVATGGNPTLSNIEQQNTTGIADNIGLPQSTAGAQLAESQRATQVANNLRDKAVLSGLLGTPRQEAFNEDTIQSRNAPLALDTSYGLNLGDYASVPSRNRHVIASSALGANTAENALSLSPYINEAQTNDAIGRAYNSRWLPAPSSAYGTLVNPDGSVTPSSKQPGFGNMMQKISAMTDTGIEGGIPTGAVDKNGKQLPVPPPSVYAPKPIPAIQGRAVKLPIATAASDTTKPQHDSKIKNSVFPSDLGNDIPQMSNEKMPLAGHTGYTVDGNGNLYDDSGEMLKNPYLLDQLKDSIIKTLSDKETESINNAKLKNLIYNPDNEIKNPYFR